MYLCYNDKWFAYAQPTDLSQKAATMSPSIQGTVSISHVIVFLDNKGAVCGMESETDAKRQLADNTEYCIRTLPYDESIHSDRDKISRTALRLSIRLLDRGYVKLTSDRDLGYGWEVTRKGRRLADPAKAAKAAARSARLKAKKAARQIVLSEKHDRQRKRELSQAS